MLLGSILASAQEEDINIMVRKGPEIGLSPDALIIFNDVAYSYTITGMKKGMRATATLTNSRWVKVVDSLLNFSVHCKPGIGDGYDTARALLKITITDSSGKKASEFERNFGVMVQQYRPFAPDSISRQLGVYISEMGYSFAFLYKGIDHSTDKDLRKNTGMKFTYVDSTAKNNFIGYRSIELRITAKGGEMKYTTPSNFVTIDMRKALRQQRGKSKYTFILHRKYARGSKKDVTDTVSYDPSTRDKTGD